MQSPEIVKKKIYINSKYTETVKLDEITIDKFKKHLKDKKISVRQLSTMIDNCVSYTYLSYLFSGRKTSISLEKLEKILKAINLTVEDILDCTINYF